MPDSAEHFAIEWLQIYGDKLYSYALSRIGGDASRAEDLVQETLLAGIEGHAKFKGNASLETWLISILRRKILDHFRRAYRNRERSDLAGKSVEEGQKWSGDPEKPVQAGNWGLDASQVCESKEFTKVFDTCLADLNPQLAEVFTLSVMDGLSTEEICSVLGITPTNLSVRLHRARLRLREMLQSRWFGSP